MILYFFLSPPLLAADRYHQALLEQHNENAVFAALANEIPDLNINSMMLVSAGWDNLVVDINNEWIFRFPRSKEFIPTLEREGLLLERLHNSVLMPVPHYQYTGSRTAFVGYRKIIGESLNEELYLNLAVEDRREIAESLALFLSQFHHAVKLEEALQWGYKGYHISLPWIEQTLLGTLSSSEIERVVWEALVYIKQNHYSTENLVLLHNDLHGGNLAFDMNAKRITGVFDFSDAAIGDYSIDFGNLFTIHPDLAIRTAKAYASLNKVADPTVPAAVDYILRRALYILYARECGDVLRESRLVQMLQRFIPVWDALQKKHLT